MLQWRHPARNKSVRSVLPQWIMERKHHYLVVWADSSTEYEWHSVKHLLPLDSNTWLLHSYILNNLLYCTYLEMLRDRHNGWPDTTRQHITFNKFRIYSDSEPFFKKTDKHVRLKSEQCLNCKLATFQENVYQYLKHYNGIILRFLKRSLCTHI